MKNFPRAIGAVSLAAILAITSSAAFAQPNGRHDQRDDHRGHNGQQHRANPPQRQMPSNMHRGDDRRHDDGRRGDWRRDGGYASNGPRGAGPQHDWRRGGRVPPSYRGYNYVVNDWRGHHLSAPPRGYHWIQNGPDYLLIAITTGVIAQLILSN